MKYIFITGPARSGQTTIVNQLNTHDNIHIFDEIPPCLPWDWDNHKRTDEFLDQIDDILKNHNDIQGKEIIGMAGLYYLKAIPSLIKKYKEIDFHILKRSFGDVLNGYMKKVNNGEDRHDVKTLSQKFFSFKDPTAGNWEITMPHYKKIEELDDWDNYREAIKKYYDEYHELAKEYEKKYNNVKIWDSEYLIENNNYLNLIK